MLAAISANLTVKVKKMDGSCIKPSAVAVIRRNMVMADLLVRTDGLRVNAARSVVL